MLSYFDTPEIADLNIFECLVKQLLGHGLTAFHRIVGWDIFPSKYITFLDWTLLAWRISESVR